MNTYYLDLGWKGGIVVVADSVEKAAELAKNTLHGAFIENLKSKFTLLKPNEVYTFMGDS
jgi:hypothetical protein